MTTENLTKSIDSMIDDLFAEEIVEVVEKSMIKDLKPQKETADEGEKPPKGQDDDSRGAGRPKQISDVPNKDTDGKRAKEYDKDITEKKTEKDGKNPEQSQVQPPKDMKKSVSDEEWTEFQEFKKSQVEAAKAEELKKAVEAQTDLIKSAVIEATAGIKDELIKANGKIDEQEELIKAMANKPQRSKAVTNVQAMEKSARVEAQPEALSKSEILDVAEDLAMNKKLTNEHVIELENTGHIYDAEARGVLEREIKRRYK